MVEHFMQMLFMEYIWNDDIHTRMCVCVYTICSTYLCQKRHTLEFAMKTALVRRAVPSRCKEVEWFERDDVVLGVCFWNYTWKRQLIKVVGCFIFVFPSFFGLFLMFSVWCFYCYYNLGLFTSFHILCFVAVVVTGDVVFVAG